MQVQVEHLLPEEVSSAYRAICSMVLVQTAVVFSSKTTRKDDIRSRRTALNWIEGGAGTLSFADCCQAIDVDEEVAYAGFRRIVDGEVRRPITKVYGRHR